MTYGIVIGILILALLATLIAVVAEKPAPREEPETDPEIAPVEAPPAFAPIDVEPAPVDAPVAYAAMTSAEVEFEVEEPPVAFEPESPPVVSEVETAVQPVEPIIEFASTEPLVEPASEVSEVEPAELTPQPATQITTAELFLDPAMVEAAVEFESEQFDPQVDDRENWKFDPETGEPIVTANTVEPGPEAESPPDREWEEPAQTDQSAATFASESPDEPGADSSTNLPDQTQLEEEQAPDESGTSESSEGTGSDSGAIRI